MTPNIPTCSILELLVKKAHGGGLMGYFWIAKSYDMLNEHFYWSQMRHDVHKKCERCIACKETKSKLKPHSIYLPLPTPNGPWLDISMEYVLGCLDLREGRITFLWWLTDLAKWHISLHVIKLMMLNM